MEKDTLIRRSVDFTNTQMTEVRKFADLMEQMFSVKPSDSAVFREITRRGIESLKKQYRF